MPFFSIFGSSLFSPKKSSPRKAKLPLSMENDSQRQKELGIDMNEIKLKLGVVSCTFDEKTGNWKNDITSKNDKKLASEIIKLRIQNKKLRKDQNLYRVKNEILLDMVSTSRVELQKATAEVKHLKGILAKSPLRFADLED